MWNAIVNLWNKLFGKKQPALPAPVPAPAPIEPVPTPEPVPVPEPVAPPVVVPPAPVPTPAPTPVAPVGWTPPSQAVKSPRRLHPEIERAVDAELLKIAPDAFKAACLANDGNALTKLCGDAFSALEIREKTNNNDGPMVEAIQYTCRGTSGQPWCMYQQQTQVAYAEKKLGIISRLPASGDCAEVRRRVPAGMVVLVSTCEPGDLWVWEHKDGSGHTGNFAVWIDKGVSAHLNEGNTTAGQIGDVIVREGGGSYYTARTVANNGDMTLKMCIRPF